MFERFFRESKIRKIEKKLKTLHFKQRRIRERIDDLVKAARDGDADAKSDLAKLEIKREALVKQVADLTTEEKALKASQ